jgi:hypothetical protein
MTVQLGYNAIGARRLGFSLGLLNIPCMLVELNSESWLNGYVTSKKNEALF